MPINPRICLFFLTLFFSTFLNGQVPSILPADRAANWSNAGFRGTIPSPTNQVNILDYGGIPFDTIDNSFAFQNAVAALGGNEGVIFFPAGNYFFSSTLALPDSLIIRGNGSNSTTLTFDLGGAGNLINVQGTATQDTSSFSATAAKGDTLISVLDASSFSSGDYIRISQVDTGLVTSSWAIGTVGQIVKINQINNDTILLNSELRDSFDLTDKPKIQKLIPKTNIGIECLKITRLDETNPSHTSSIRFKYATQSWVKGVESDITNFAHVTIDASTNITVTGSYFHHAFNYGGGGRAYGVMIQQTGNECRVENNVFKHLRHSMIVQSGANGNVFGYNYSYDPFWTGTSFPSNAAGDMVCHGNYVFANLFEGNIGQQIVIDVSHGANGPHNTFFRSREELYGIFMSHTSSPEQNFIGNEIPNGPENNYGLYRILGENHLLHGNNIRDTITPIGTDTLLDISYYHDSIPDFMPPNYPYPPIGFPHTINTNSIPAKDRTAVGGPFTVCSPPAFVADSDNDGFNDQLDNCPDISNPNQSNTDGDIFGEACDCNDNNANDSRLIINNPITSQTYSSNDFITSAGTVDSAIQAVFQANRMIILKPNFVAEAGSDFTAKIDSCDIPIAPFVAEDDDDILKIEKEKKKFSNFEEEEIQFNIFPNPFETSTTITFSLTKNEKVSLLIFDGRGRQIEQLLNNSILSNGEYSFLFDASNLPSGLYSCILKTDNHVMTQRMVIIKK